jgi:two-component system nitrate/nitrite response regulator NarL
MNEPIKIIIIKDPKLLRETFVSQLKPYNSIEVIGTVGNGIEALELLKNEQPDILILDIEMPLMNGELTAREVKKKYPKIKIIILSRFEERYYVLEFFKLGVSSYLTKDASIDEVVEAIIIVNKEGKFINGKVAKLIQGYSTTKPKNYILGRESLEDAEIKILKLICEGKRGKEIADELQISIDTLNFHKRNIKNKTGYDSIAQLVLYAVKHGIISLKEI